MKELQELPAWWGEGIFSSSSSFSEDEPWKSNLQISSQGQNMEDEHTRWKIDFRREGKYRGNRNASQTSLQLSLNKFKLTSWYPWNNMANLSSSNLFISQQISQPNEGTRRNRAHTQTTLGDHSVPKLVHIQHTPHIQPKNLKTSENHKEPQNEKET